MTTETINGLHSCKPGNEPIVGETKTFVVEHRPARNGKKPWIKIRSAGADYGGEPYRILSAEPTGFTDTHGNISFNIEIEPATAAPEASPRAPQSPPAHQNGSEIVKYAAYSRKVFEQAWDEAGNWIKLLPKKDAEDLSVSDYYDLRMRVAQHIAIETSKIIRKERF